MFVYSTLIFENQQNSCVGKKRVASHFLYRHAKDNTASLHPPSYSGPCYVTNYKIAFLRLVESLVLSVESDSISVLILYIT